MLAPCAASAKAHDQHKVVEAPGLLKVNLRSADMAVSFTCLIY